MGDNTNIAQEVDELIESIFDAIDRRDKVALPGLLIRWKDPRIAEYIQAVNLKVHNLDDDCFAVFAADVGDIDTLRILHAHNINLAEIAPNNWTAATWAANIGDTDVLKALDEMGYRLYEPNQTGQTPLEIGRAKYIETLQDYEKAYDAVKKARTEKLLNPAKKTGLKKLERKAKKAFWKMNDLADATNFLEDYEERDSTYKIKRQDAQQLGYLDPDPMPEPPM